MINENVIFKNFEFWNIIDVGDSSLRKVNHGRPVALQPRSSQKGHPGLWICYVQGVGTKASAIIPPSHSGVFSFTHSCNSEQRGRELGPKRLQSSPQVTALFSASHSEQLASCSSLEPLKRFLFEFDSIYASPSGRVSQRARTARTCFACRLRMRME
ncbi:hypothetical protein CDAR_63511 [Caerostris darwini]|uniref:Uncharacterized protein n=1 Tax=Caerostris darwini TaxID=1538125 RepID=A0AAV4QIG1_9ARAC|nr:hypothetical protein CDAR_63511 [Caerostris darwini]